MIEIKRLTKSFEDKTVLKGIDCVFETGKTNLIIGQSGSGKTVLMKNIVGLLEPSSGEILYDGRNFVTMSKHEKVHMRREMGMIFQCSFVRLAFGARKRDVSPRHVLHNELARTH